MDDLDEYLQEQLKDPEYAKAYAEVRARQKKLVSRLCSQGVCAEFYDPETGVVDHSIGPADCLCTE